VYIEYSSRRLTEASLTLSVAVRLFGISVGRKYIQRLAILRAAGTFSQLFGLKALRLHPLKGPRTGDFAITLTGNYRLIIQKLGEDKVLVIDVEDYHGN
jgi:toxin HigB-1